MKTEVVLNNGGISLNNKGDKGVISVSNGGIKIDYSNDLDNAGSSTIGNVYLLIDVSGSMLENSKLEMAKKRSN
jgi:uncharacterized protein with von Willebrand factor type A (vWA) domain